MADIYRYITSSSSALYQPALYQPECDFSVLVPAMDLERTDRLGCHAALELSVRGARHAGAAGSLAGSLWDEVGDPPSADSTIHSSVVQSTTLCAAA